VSTLKIRHQKKKFRNNQEKKVPAAGFEPRLQVSQPVVTTIAL
jgi:hypothetical protein